jgi:DNA-binding CsgD family transcriptional regulator/predicted house-cleaning noncanonical NTP pyrophosphatase (MazG superfamily)
MNKHRFETVLQQLTPRRREVLELFLAGKSDGAIAQSLCIAKTTVRQHIRNICQAFGLKNDFDDDYSSQRANLKVLFTQYKPELLPKPTVTGAGNQKNEGILLSNDINPNTPDVSTDSNLSLEHNQLKQTLKKAIIEIFSENKEEFSAILTEIIKDIALSKAFEERELTDRETIEDTLLNVIGILSGEPISIDNIDEVKFQPKTP